MKKINVLYIFKRPVAEDMKKAQIGNYPKDFFYGVINSNKNIEIKVFDDFFYKSLLQKIRCCLFNSGFCWTYFVNAENLQNIFKTCRCKYWRFVRYALGGQIGTLC